MNHLSTDCAVQSASFSGSPPIPSAASSPSLSATSGIGFNTSVRRTNSAPTSQKSACNWGQHMTLNKMSRATADAPFSWSLLEPTPLREDFEGSRKPVAAPACIQAPKKCNVASVHCKTNELFHGPEMSTRSMNLKQVIAQSVRSSDALLDAMTAKICPPAPRRENALLHIACSKTSFCEATIDRLLRMDPMCAKRRFVLKTNRLVLDRVRKTLTRRSVREKYSFPLHLAIDHGAPMRVILMLVKAAPSMLTMRDGPQNETPIMILLKTRSGRKSDDEAMQLIEVMLRANPACCDTNDARHGNTPLHVAVARGVSSLNIIKLLSNPAALKHRNSHGLTPLELCQHRGCTCSEEVARFLWEQTEAASSRIDC